MHWRGTTEFAYRRAWGNYRLMRHAIMLFIALALTSSDLYAQADPQTTMLTCLDTIAESAFSRVPVYLLPTVNDSAERAILPAADILADMVARQVRADLRTDISPLPEGEPAISWRDIDREIVVTVVRDGSFSWRVDDSGSLLRSAGEISASSDPVVRALATAHDAGERLFWPADAVGDSLSFRLQLSHAVPTREGALVSAPLRVSIPIFSLAIPWMSPVSVTLPPSVGYPENLLRMGMSGTIVLRYVVNPDGRADPATLTDVWNSPQPYPRGELGRVYRGFIATVRRALPAARFEPALAGGCPVPQLVQQPFVFSIRK